MLEGCQHHRHGIHGSACAPIVVSAATAWCMCAPCCHAGDFLQPDEVTFAVMLRGYGNQNPPDWQKIDSVLTQMKMTYGLEPSASKQ